MSEEQYLKNGTILKGRNSYVIKKKLGQGGFGITYLAEAETPANGYEELFAIKEYFPRDFCVRTGTNMTCIRNQEMVDELKDKFEKEVERILRVPHKNVVKTYELFEMNDTAYYVMEYAPGDSLEEFKEEVPERIAIGYIVPIAEAISVLHQRRINHLDIKPENIVLRQNGEPVLIDFGIARGFDKTGEHQTSVQSVIAHSSGYAPHEQYNGSGITTFSPQADIYALGATLYRLVTGQKPAEPVNLVMNNYKDLAFPRTVSIRTQQAIKYAMQFQPEKRPKNVAEFLAVLDPNNAQCTVPAYVSGVQDSSPMDDGGTRIERAPQPAPVAAPTVQQPVSSQPQASGSAVPVAPPKKNMTTILIAVAVIVIAGFVGFKFIGSDKGDTGLVAAADSTALSGANSGTSAESQEVTPSGSNATNTQKKAEVTTKTATPATSTSSQSSTTAANKPAATDDTPAQKTTQEATQSAAQTTVEPTVISQPAATDLSADELVSKGLSASKKFQYDSAADYFTKAVNKGSTTGAYYLGDLYYNGNGVAKSFPTAKKYFAQAANAGFVQAQYMLGMMYRNGQGGDKDISQARIWLQKAANAGHAQAQNALKNL